MQEPGEKGLPGVRIGSVEGLVMETDAFGRFHLVGISGGVSARGRNFILKADAATLPPGSTFTTENPRVRRLTPGLPVRFDFGVRRPQGRIGGGSAKATVELGEVLFERGSASIDPQYAPLLQQMLQPIRTAGGGKLFITAHAEQEALALRRAQALRAALTATLEPAVVARTSIDVRAEIDASQALLSLDSHLVLGTLLFDTDRADIRPQYRALLEQIAADINRKGEGTLEIAGHADSRGEADYNLALSRRRAQAVFEAIAAQLTPEVRQRLRVEPVAAAASTDSGRR